METTRREKAEQQLRAAQRVIWRLGMSSIPLAVVADLMSLRDAASNELTAAIIEEERVNCGL